MSKSLLKKELIFLDIEQNTAKFFHIELLSVGFNQLQLISTTGNFNTKGRAHIVRLEGTEAFQKGRILFYQKLFEKKAAGYSERPEAHKWQRAFHEAYVEEHLQVLTEHRNTMKQSTKKNKQKKKNKVSVASTSTFHCSLCHQTIPEGMYDKINEWARGEGNWDYSSSCVGYQKVLCISCQIAHDIFKKKLEKNA